MASNRIRKPYKYYHPLLYTWKVYLRPMLKIIFKVGGPESHDLESKGLETAYTVYHHVEPKVDMLSSLL